MREHYKSKILKLLRHVDYEPAKLSQLAEVLGVSTEDYAEFKRLLRGYDCQQCELHKFRRNIVIDRGNGLNLETCRF